MKKIISLVLVMALAISLAACGAGASNGSSAAPAAPAATSAPVAASNAGEVTGDKQELVLFAASISENTPTGAGLKAMADFINANSNGTLTAIDYYDTALGDASSLTEALKTGTVDVGVSGTAYFSSLVPEIEVFQLPFLFSDLETARAICAGPVAEEINQMFAPHGIIGLSFWENGFRELSNNKVAVKTPADMNGIKMRTLGAKVQIATWTAFGAMTTQIDASELYTSLQQGTIDAQDNPLHEIVSRKLYEVQPYVSLTDATYTPFYMAISQMKWDALSDSQKALVKEAAAVGRQAQLDATDAAQATAKQTLIDNGVTVVEDVDKAAFQALAMPQWEIFTSQSETAVKLLEEVQAAM